MTNFASSTILPAIAAWMSAVRKLRILVADDNPLSLRFLAEALAGLGHDVVEAEDGAVALDRANATACDVLLLDARMPGLGGPEVLATVRAQPGSSQHSIALATTADNDPAVHAALLAANFAAVLVKPLGVETLRTTLNRHVPEMAWTDETLDDTQALAAVGGDAAIVAALRGLFASELEALPGELATFGNRKDASALRERLHRLDASAGFCGAPAVLRAVAGLRIALDAPVWPHAAITDFLAACERARALLVR